MDIRIESVDDRPMTVAELQLTLQREFACLHPDCEIGGFASTLDRNGNGAVVLHIDPPGTAAARKAMHP